MLRTKSIWYSVNSKYIAQRKRTSALAMAQRRQISSIKYNFVSSITSKTDDDDIMNYIYYYDFQLQKEVLVLFNPIQLILLKRT